MTQATKATPSCPKCGSVCFSASNFGKTCNSCGEKFDLKNPNQNLVAGNLPTKVVGNRNMHHVFVNGQDAGEGSNFNRR